jgi:hypothetical protein
MGVSVKIGLRSKIPLKRFETFESCLSRGEKWDLHWHSSCPVTIYYFGIPSSVLLQAWAISFQCVFHQGQSSRAYFERK